VIYRFGAWTVGSIAAGQLWRLVMPIFLHFDALHLIFNCIWLIQLGPPLENALGRARYLTLYLLSGIGGFVLSASVASLSPGSPIGGGASGVVFGLIAAALVLGYLRRIPGADVFRAGLLKWVIFVVILSLLISNVDHLAHGGGALVGALMALKLAHRSQARRLPDRFWSVAELLCVLIILVSIVATGLNPPLVR